MAKDSKEIETAVKVFVDKFKDEMDALRKEAEKDGGDAFPADVVVVVSANKVSVTRTPVQQAAEVLKGKSWTCRSSHMSDNARHVYLKVDGTAYYGLSEAKPLKKHQEAFKKAWGRALKAAKLKNYHGKDGYASGDEFHVELPDSKLPAGDKRVLACYDEYVRKTREDGKAKNKKFEKDAKSDIAKTVKRLGLPEEKDA